ncbi:hypothetical protein C818_01257 [Lachnospiraceae bacterium MD308]|nr:hypothetical protein C818_01257 [Lachnospiraceae bacterium MD308]
MLSTEKEQIDFCTEFNISGEKFRNSRLTWEELAQIADDFERKRNEHRNTVMQYAEVLQKCLGVHSLSYRVKDTKHLIEKIIRKNPKYLETGNALCLDNYEQEITDLMGIRILLLFKEDWLEVHNYVMGMYEEALLETPFAYVREGDDTRLYEDKVEIRKEKPYRSVHYVIQSDKGAAIEIQVRTLYEEAWSEIDHKLRYPYNLTNEMLANYINIMNRLTGMGDEMGTFIHSYIKNFQESLYAGVTDDNEVYHFILREIEKCDNAEVKQTIADKIKQADSYREMKKMSDLLKDVLQYKQ